MELTLKDLAAGGSTEITLQVASDDDGIPVLLESRAPTIPPRQSQGVIDAGHFDPETDFVWEMDDFSGGALEPYYRPGSNKYTTANGMDARNSGVLVLLPPRASNSVSNVRKGENASVDFILRNHSAQFQNTTGWTADNSTTLTADTDAVLNSEDSYGFKAVTSGSLSAGDSLFHQDVNNPTIFQGKSVTFTLTGKKNAGGGTARLFIEDSAGTTTGGTISGATSSPEMSRTIDGAATFVRFGVEAVANEATSNTYFFDNIFASPDVASGSAANFVGTATLGDDLYCAVGKVIYKWNDSSNIALWNAVYISSSSATDIIQFEGAVYVAYGSGNAYVYGSDTTWTARATGDTDAIFFATGRNGAGANALWKSDANNKVRNTTDGTEAGAAWSSQIDVGDSNYEITSMYGVFDSIVIGKEDGLYSYRRFDLNSSTGDNLFENVSPDWTQLPDTKNFKRGALWGGWLWLAVLGGFVRWQPGNLQILTSLFVNEQAIAEQFDIIAMLASPQQLLVSTKQRLYSLRVKQDEFFIHSMYGFNTFQKNGNDVMAYNISEESLFIMGKITRSSPTSSSTYPVGHRYLMGKDHLSSAFDAGRLKSLSFTGTLDTPIWHGGMISAPKAFVSLTLLLGGTVGNGTVEVLFALDGSTTFNSLGTFAAGTSIETKYFHAISAPETNAVGRTIQLRFKHSFTSASAGAKPLFQLGFSLHSTLRLDRLRTWEIDVVGSDHSMTDSGMEAPESFSGILAALNTLELQNYPIVMDLDTDEDGVIETTTVYLRDVQRKRVSEDDEVISLLIQEAKTSA